MNRDDDRGVRFGRFHVVSRIGWGGMGEVFFCRDVRSGREVALKLIRAGMDQDPYFRSMFLREAQASSGFHHPNVVETLEAGQEGAVLYLAQEYVRGASLAALLEHGIEPSLAAFILCEVLEALAYVHRAEDDSGRRLLLAHRDISPANILISSQGEVKLADFGIAKLADSDMTRASEVKGSPRYMSPEQAGALGPTNTIDHRSDLFSVGVVLYRLVRGQPLFHEVDRWISEGARIPEGPLSTALARSLAVAPDQRYRSAEEFLQELRPVVSDPTWCRQRLAALVSSVATPPKRPSPLESLVLQELESEAGHTRRLGGGESSEEPDVGRSARGDGGPPARGWVAGGLVLVVLIAAGVGSLVVTGGLPGRSQGPEWASRAVPGAQLSEQMRERQEHSPVDEVLARRDAGAKDSGPPSADPKPDPPEVDARATKPPRKRLRRTANDRRRGRGNDRRPGLLTLHSEPWAKVYLGKRLLGTTPFARVSLPPGTHRLKLETGGRTRFVKVSIRPGELTRKRVKAPR